MKQESLDKARLLLEQEAISLLQGDQRSIAKFAEVELDLPVQESSEKESQSRNELNIEAEILQIIPKSKIKPRKRKKKKKTTQNLQVPIALQKFSFVNTTEQASDFGRTESGAFGRTESGGNFGRTDSGPFGMTAVSGKTAAKFFGEATLSNLGKQFPAPKSRIGDDTLSVLSKEFSLARLRLQSIQGSQKGKDLDDTLLKKAENIIKMGRKGKLEKDDEEELTAAQKLKQIRDRDKVQRKIMQTAVAHTTVEQANAKIIAAK